MSSLRWYGVEAKVMVRHRTLQGLRATGAACVTRARELLAVQGTPQDRSAPGEPPRRQTGNLQESVTYQVDEATLTVVIGTDVDYGYYLEFGNKRGLLPRPWLRRALLETAAQIERFFGEFAPPASTPEGGGGFFSRVKKGVSSVARRVKGFFGK